MPVRRFSKPLDENTKHKQNKDLQQSETGAYTPAYKQNQKTAENQAETTYENLCPALAEIVTVWPELPEHIKAAVKALIRTHNSKDAEQ